MQRRIKIWTKVGYAALAGGASVLLSGCGGEGGATKPQERDPAATAGPIASPAGENSALGPADVAHHSPMAGAGEGEGAPAGVDLKTDHVAYLTQLSLAKGHLLAGLALYRQGAEDRATGHFLHPGIELYAALEPALAARGAPPFKAELESLAALAGKSAPGKDIAHAYRRVFAAIETAERAGTGATLDDPKSVVKLIQQIVRAAANEYADAVQDGKVVLAVEYQDAYGFIGIAKERLNAVAKKAHPPQVQIALLEVRRQLDELSPAWPDGQLIPPERVAASASMFFGAAARIEIAGLSL